jgi:predicted RNase H-like HicB family nuclease
MSSYIALIHKDPNSDYGVSFPDFPGCISAEDSMDKIKDMATEALSGHIQTMIEYGDQIPAPSTFEDIIADPANSEAIAFLLVTIPEPQTNELRITNYELR